MKSIALIFLITLVSTALAGGSRRHFYTTDANGEAAAQDGLAATGISAFVWSSQTDGTIPIYRCYNSGQDLHFYTTDQACEGAGGYALEGVGYYVMQNQAQGSTAYQRYSQDNGDHWYAPAANVTRQDDFLFYNFEGNLGYVFQNQAAGTTALYSFTKGSNLDGGTEDP